MGTIYRNGIKYGGSSSGGGSVDSVSVNGGTPILPDSNGNVNINMMAYANNDTVYVATIEDGDSVVYPHG